LRPVEVIQVEHGQDVVIFDESDFLAVEAADKTRRLDVALLLALNGKNQLREHPMYVRRMVLCLGPEDRCVGDEGHLARVAAFRQYAEIDVADDAVAVVLTEVRGRYAILQFFFSDGGFFLHGWCFCRDIIADSIYSFPRIPV